MLVAALRRLERLAIPAVDIRVVHERIVLGGVAAVRDEAAGLAHALLVALPRQSRELELVGNVRGRADRVLDRIFVVEHAEVLAARHPQVVRLARVDVGIVITGRDRAFARELVDERRLVVAEDIVTALVLHHDREHGPCPRRGRRRRRTAGCGAHRGGAPRRIRAARDAGSGKKCVRQLHVVPH